MKKFFFFSFIIISIFNVLLAQELSKMNTTTPKEVNTKDWRVLLQVTGPSNWTGSINAVKPVSEKWFIRIGASPIYDNEVTKKSDKSNIYIIDEHISRRNAWGASLGIGPEYHFDTKSKLDPFIGMGANFGFSMGKTKSESKTEYVQALSNGLIKESEYADSKGKPNFNINPFGSFGVNYYIHPKFAIGAEYGIGPQFNLMNRDGRYKRTSTKTYADGTVETSVNENSPNQKSRSLGTTLNQRVGLHFIYVIERKEK